jgi:hypothetical protein
VTSFRRSAAVSGAWLAALLALGAPQVYSHLGSRAANVLESLRSPRLSARDAELLHRGYYEDLVRVDRFNGALWQVYMKRPLHWPPISETEAGRWTRDFLTIELVPSTEIEYHGALFRTNRFGMRDREYERAKPPGAFRVALIGSSHAVGEGVANEEVFEERLEQRWSRELGADGRARVEILNFSIGAFTPLELLATLEAKAFGFDPDAVFYVAHPTDMEAVVSRLLEHVRSGVEIPYDHLRETLRRAGVGRETAVAVGRKALEPFAGETISWLYRRIAEQCRGRGAIPVWILLPIIHERTPRETGDELARRAEEAGFAVLSLQGLYDGLDTDLLRVAEWDNHPNAQGHQLIADRIDALLREKGALPLLARPAAGSQAPASGG